MVTLSGVGSGEGDWAEGHLWLCNFTYQKRWHCQVKVQEKETEQKAIYGCVTYQWLWHCQAKVQEKETEQKAIYGCVTYQWLWHCQAKVQEKETEQKAIQDELQSLNRQVEELVPQKDQTQKARDLRKKVLKTAQVSHSHDL